MSEQVWLCSACGQENSYAEDVCCTQCHKAFESDLDEIVDAIIGR